jgi:uncharacterized protein (TIGR02996 family)
MATPIPDEQAALLAAISAEPDDDAPRLVYADWLQENGDEEQARFIRDWIALDWLEEHEDEKRQTIAKRLDGAEVRNGSRWLAELGVVGAEPVYERGMAEGVIYDGFASFRQEAQVLFARVPVRELTIHGFGGYESDSPLALLGLARMPELERLRTLRLSNNGYEFPPDAWNQFATSPHLAKLQTLAVQYAGLTDEDVGRFERCETRLDHLEELGFSGNRITAAGALALVRSKRLPNLKRLGLAHNYITEDRRRGSAYLALRDALLARFDSTSALGSIV